jgi:hypothetical protein
MMISVALDAGSSYTLAWSRSGCNNSTMAAITPTTTSTSSSYTFAPTASDICAGNDDNVYTFKVVVTNANGCKDSVTKKLNVVNPFVSGGNVQVCHRTSIRGGGITTSLMQIPYSQVAAHLAHNDYLGNCPIFTGVKGTEPAVIEGQAFAVYPNPTTGVFIVELSSVTTGANILITDMQGRTVATKALGKDVAPVATFNLSSLARGIYLIQVTDGDARYRSKIVVQ